MQPYIRPSFRQGSRGWLGEQTLTISNFGGGMNNVEADNIIADNELSDCLNMRFISNTSMEKRNGITALGSFAKLSDPITWIDEYKPLLNESSVIRCTDKEVYIGDKKICDVEGRVRGVNYIGKYYFVDGKSLRVYNGTKVYKIIGEPVGYTSEDTASGVKTFKLKKIPQQVKNGDKVLILSSIIGAEADFTTTVASIDADAKTVTLTAGPTAKVPKGSPIFFYIPADTKAIQGEEVWDDTLGVAYYKPCRLQMADSYAGGGYIPDTPSVIAIHKDRLFIAGDVEQPHSVYMNFINQPLYFPSGSYVSVKPNGEKIVDMVVFDDALIIGRHNDMFVLYGSSVYPTSPNTFSMKQMDVSTGFMCADCGSLLNNFYIFLGFDGRFYKLNTPTTFVEYLMTRPLDWKIDLYKEPFNCVKGELTVSSTSYYNEVFFNFNNDLVLVYNYDNMAWTYYKGWNASNIYSDGKLIYLGAVNGEFYSYSVDGSNYNDLDKPIEIKLHTKRYDLGNSINYKYFKRFLCSTHAYDDFLSSLHVAIEVDSASNDDFPVIIASNTARYGVAKWGMNLFDRSNLFKSGWFNIDGRGRTIKFKITNNELNECLRLYDINLCYSARDVR